MSWAHATAHFQAPATSASLFARMCRSPTRTIFFMAPIIQSGIYLKSGRAAADTKGKEANMINKRREIGMLLDALARRQSWGIGAELDAEGERFGLSMDDPDVIEALRDEWEARDGRLVRK